jgi:NAD(P)-dependent dehydrogenase (short-subunit alcohol dehydrogenase family)
VVVGDEGQGRRDVKRLREALAARYPLKRVGTPADVAALAKFLLSVESDWMTGQVFGVDGGMSTLRTSRCLHLVSISAQRSR